MKLKLKKSSLQIETELGIIDINQIENSIKFSVEIFPINQSTTSFEEAEFNNIVDIRDLKSNSFELLYCPQSWTREQICEIYLIVYNNLIKLIKQGNIV